MVLTLSSSAVRTSVTVMAGWCGRLHFAAAHVQNLGSSHPSRWSLYSQIGFLSRDSRCATFSYHHYRHCCHQCLFMCAGPVSISQWVLHILPEASRPCLDISRIFCKWREFDPRYFYQASLDIWQLDEGTGAGNPTRGPRRSRHASWTDVELRYCTRHEDISHIVKTPTDSSASELDITPSFLHSPLLYWNCSAAAIESDNSILMTINSQAHRISPTNLTLRPSSVLTGIRLSHNGLVAADALVVSFFYKAESRAGDLWDERAEALAQLDKSRWDVYPADGRETSSRFFKFQSRPTGVQDRAIFFGSYCLVLLYVIFSLRNLTTLKNRVGLCMTIALQVSTF